MQTLRYTFLVLKWCGLWRPEHWPSSKKAMLYDVYTSFMMFFFVAIILSQFVELVRGSADDVDALANNTFILLTLVADCGKASNILIKRGDLIELENSLRTDPCRPRTDEEFAIQRKFDRVVRFNTLCYSAVVWTAAIVFVLSSMLEDIPRRTMPYQSWMPFSYGETGLGYSIAYSHQIFGILFGTTISIAFDTLVSGLMLQTCAQLNILMHRFDKMPAMLLEMADELRGEGESYSFNLNAETVLLSQRVRHHLAIFKFAKKSNDLFGVMIFLQYAISSSVLCVSMLRLSKEKLFSSAFMALFVYLAEMSIQIMLYCFYGGEVTIESVKVCDAIYEMDWPVLSTSARRSLLMIMARTLRPITFTTAHVVTLNLDSFKSLVKFSYSTYNVL